MASITYGCPDCGNIMISECQQCPNCGCPSNFFKKIEPINNAEEIEPINNAEELENLPYYVNPSAEKIGGTIATVLLVIHIIIGTVAIIASFALISENPIGIIPLFLGATLIIFGIVIWAVMRLFVNISQSLYNINDAIRRSNK